MGRFIGPETVEISYVATIAVPTAPTAAELNAGVDLTAFVVPGGLDLPFPGETVDASDLSSRQRKQAPGMYGGNEGTLTFHRDKVFANDTAWVTLPPGTDGFFVVAPRGLATPGTFAIADRVDIYPMEVITRDPSNLAADNETQQFTVSAVWTGVVTRDFPIAA